MKFKGFLFDCDGTVLDSNPLIMNAWRTAVDFFLPGKPVTDYDIRKYFGRTFDESAQLLAQEFGVEDYDLAEIADVYWTYHKNHPEDINGVFPTVEEALDALKARGIKLGIVTSGFSDVCSRELEELGIRELFDAVVGAGEVTEGKPSPQPALICCKQLGLAPQEVLMIGDSRHDMTCGKKAGCTTAMVSWTLCDPQELEGTEKPDMLLSDARQLLDYI